jgi:hypothetical protein
VGNWLFLCVLSGLLLSPASPLRSSYARPCVGTENPLFTRPVTEGRRSDAGASRALEQGTDFFEAADFFIDCSN